MSKKEEIKISLIVDLEASPEQLIFNDFLNDLKLSISNPGIEYVYVKFYDNSFDAKTQSILKLISQKDLGFECFVMENSIGVNMINFLK